ncbi:hypothetical protein BDV29DRAFT_187545 [Aspergillus leporis]|uniref:GST N-terminal domain-containing protein n=1 Tax=Aspergillus leporis TaxID=41062 RepID=A0A5N5XDT1_9EURO|nr:hypothetical protein BDV29DRAFT_187545 [Aspergillus leporis]
MLEYFWVTILDTTWSRKGDPPRKNRLPGLQSPYETKFVGFADVKKESCIYPNSNGQLPTIEDQENGITLWESVAIIKYLIHTYSQEDRISRAAFHDRYYTQARLHFQMSSQGPYYGQTGWLVRSHPENVPSAIERYQNELRRVTRKWAPVLGGDDIAEAFPRVARWINELRKRPAVGKVLDDQERALAERE